MFNKLCVLLAFVLLLLCASCGKDNQSPAPTLDFGDNKGTGGSGADDSQTMNDTPIIPLPETIYTLDPNASLLASITDFRPYKSHIIYERCRGEFSEAGMKLIGEADGTLPVTDYRRSAWIYGLEAILEDIKNTHTNIQLEIIIDREQTTATRMKIYYTTEEKEWFDSPSATDKNCSVRLYNEESYFFPPNPITPYTKFMLWPLIGNDIMYIKQINIYSVSD